MSGTRPVIVEKQADLDLLASWMTVESVAAAMMEPNGPAVLRALFKTPRAPWARGPDGTMLMGLDDPPTPCLSILLREHSESAEPMDSGGSTAPQQPEPTLAETVAKALEMGVRLNVCREMREDEVWHPPPGVKYP